MYIEKGIQRVRIKLNRLQQDSIQTPSTSIADKQPRHLLEQHYHEHQDKDQDRVQMRYEHDENDLPYDSRQRLEKT